MRRCGRGPSQLDDSRSRRHLNTAVQGPDRSGPEAAQDCLRPRRGPLVTPSDVRPAATSASPHPAAARTNWWCRVLPSHRCSEAGTRDRLVWGPCRPASLAGAALAPGAVRPEGATGAERPPCVGGAVAVRVLSRCQGATDGATGWRVKPGFWRLLRLLRHAHQESASPTRERGCGLLSGGPTVRVRPEAPSYQIREPVRRPRRGDRLGARGPTGGPTGPERRTRRRRRRRVRRAARSGSGGAWGQRRDRLARSDPVRPRGEGAGGERRPSRGLRSPGGRSALRAGTWSPECGSPRPRPRRSRRRRGFRPAPARRWGSRSCRCAGHPG